MDLDRVKWILRSVLPAVALVPFLVFGTQGSAQDQVPPHHAVGAFGYALLAVSAAVLAGAGLLPRLAVVAESTVLVVWLAMDYPHGPVYIPVLLSIAFLAARRPLHESVPVIAAAGAALTAAQLATRTDGWFSRAVVAVGMAGVVGLALAFGLLLRRSRAAAERARTAATERAAEHERLQIAREVHDVVGHGLAVIALQAGVALHVVDRRPEAAKDALEAIRRASQDALDELRTTLAVFRNPGEQPELAPLAGLSRLPALVAELRAAGLAVEVRMAGGLPDELPAAVTRVAYRVVQEATTNVLRHAGAATACVRVACADGRLTVDVENPPGPVPASLTRAGGSGTGLAGLRERAEAVGGSCTAGPTAAGGWLVEAVLPA